MSAILTPPLCLSLLRNLLGENPSDKLDIKLNPDGSGQLYVPGLTEFTVQSPEDINRVSTSCPFQSKTPPVPFRVKHFPSLSE